MNAAAADRAVLAAISDGSGTAERELTRETELRAIGLDSLDHLELAVDLEERLGVAITDQEALAWRTVGDVQAFAQRMAVGQ